MAADIRIGIIGGTGLGDALLDRMDPQAVETRRIETPFGAPSSPVVTGRYGDVPLAILSRHGDGHIFNPAAVPYRANVYALKACGCTHVVASGATGSLREGIVPGNLVLCDQLIDRTSNRPRTFFERAAVHVELADPFCPVMRRWLLKAAGKLHDIVVHPRGMYVCMEGPSFSTRAESNLHRAWGADVVGMTALPEARLAREAEMAYALVAIPTDYDCWRNGDDEAGEAAASPGESLLAEVMANLGRATDAAIALIQAALADLSELRAGPSPAHDALRRGIWSAKGKIDPNEVERLKVLWGRYF
ncbi:MAG: MTAP family purine nucleoside phosphorylase [Planctomycetota bacterium]|jgi:5'-methylthioadenosine phosphorylase